jgi:carbon storage regulator
VLSITRRVGERIVIGDDIVLHVQEVSGSTVRIGIEAPKATPVYREEIWAAVKEENAAAAQAAGELPSGPLKPPARDG